MLPDLVSGDVGRLIGAFHDPFQGFVVIPIKLGFIEALCPLLDERIVVIGFLEIQIILAVVWVRGNKLATDGFMDFSQHCLDLGQQIICRVAAKVPDARAGIGTGYRAIPRLWRRLAHVYRRWSAGGSTDHG